MKNLKKLREERKLSQVKLAEMTGFSRSKIQRHERDGVNKRCDVSWYRKILLSGVMGGWRETRGKRR